MTRKEQIKEREARRLLQDDYRHKFYQGEVPEKERRQAQ